MRAWTAWVAPALLTLVMGAIGITRQAWRDEHATWQAATMPVGGLREHLAHKDVVFAPYYLFMRVWIGLFGDSVVAMRVPSVLAMAAAAGLVGALGAQLFDRWAGIAAGCLFAVVPSVSRYAAEARPYSLAVAFAILTVWAVMRRQWVGLGFAVALTGFSHLVALLVLLAHVPMVVHGGGRAVRAWAVAVGIGLVPVIPLAVLGVRQTHQVGWIESGLRAAGTLPMNLFKSAVVAGIVAALAGVAILGSRWDWRIAMLVTWAGAPPLVLFIATPDLFYYRYLLFTLPAWVLLAAMAIPRGRAVTVPAVLAMVVLLGARDHFAVRRSPLPGDQDYRAAAAYVGDHSAPGDRIFFSGYGDRRERLGFAYELRHRGAVPQECLSCLDRVSRVWLVTNGEAVTVAGFTALESVSFPGITVTLLTRAG